MKYNFSFTRLIAILSLVGLPMIVMAQGPAQPDQISNPLAIVLLVIIAGLLLAIALLANIVISAAQLYTKRFKEVQKQISSTTKSVGVIILLCLSGQYVFAQDSTAATQTAVTQGSNSIGGLSQFSFLGLVSVIALELIVLVLLVINLKSLLAKERNLIASSEEKQAAIVAERTKDATPFWTKFWRKINAFKPIEDEASLELDHNYDGIKELDNRLPPWWLYFFYVTIIFAGVYMWRYHVVHSAPLSEKELEISIEKAEKEKEAYLKKVGNQVDENTVKLLTDAADLEAGKKIFTNPSACAQCHSVDGGGGIGPNLTDDYWLHGNKINDIFKTIKYGVPGKAMQSWKDMYSPLQIAQLSSYIKSLHGTKPANPKAPEGTLYQEDDSATSASGADSTGTAPKADSTAVPDSANTVK